MVESDSCGSCNCNIVLFKCFFVDFSDFEWRRKKKGYLNCVTNFAIKFNFIVKSESIFDIHFSVRYVMDEHT